VPRPHPADTRPRTPRGRPSRSPLPLRSPGACRSTRASSAGRGRA